MHEGWRFTPTELGAAAPPSSIMTGRLWLLRCVSATTAGANLHRDVLAAQLGSSPAEIAGRCLQWGSKITCAQQHNINKVAMCDIAKWLEKRPLAASATTAGALGGAEHAAAAVARAEHESSQTGTAGLPLLSAHPPGALQTRSLAHLSSGKWH
jgi:hypothetical protein